MMAATYAAEIVKNYPFLDGNKRTGFVFADTSLKLTGSALPPPEEEAVRQTLAIAAGETGGTEYAGWLAANSVPRKER